MVSPKCAPGPERFFENRSITGGFRWVSIQGTLKQQFPRQFSWARCHRVDAERARPERVAVAGRQSGIDRMEGRGNQRNPPAQDSGRTALFMVPRQRQKAALFASTD
jgi:hypothetical protein